MIEATDWFSLWLMHLAQVSVTVFVVYMIVKLLGKNRPHFAHALWALVILKSLTPPIVALPTSPFCWLGNGSRANSSIVNDGPIEQSKLRAEVVQSSPNSTDALQPAIELGTQAALHFTPMANPAPSNLRSIAWRQIAIVVWLAGILVATSLLTAKLLRLLWRIGRHSLEPNDLQSCQARQLVQLLGHELKLSERLRKRIQVRIVDSNIGPAVMGYLRPTVLIPTCIVNSVSAQQLKLLLAHELIHLKRRDLNWAGLQTLSSIVWWFNPLVHIASRELSLESERCCDEETLASLKCEPAAYARCLIEILQMKHRLDVLPALPGIRPVEITAKRMERIMRMGTHGFSTRPWWVWPLLCIAGLVALPGAQWLSGQTSEPKPLAPKQSASILPLLVAPEDKPQKSAEQKVREYRVGKLINKIRDEEKLTHDLAVQELKAFLHGAASNMGTKRTSPLNFELIESETIRASLTDNEHEKVQAEITRLEKFGAKQMVIETQMITIPAETLKAIVLDWKSGSTQADYDSDQGTTNEAAPTVGNSFRSPFLLAEINKDQLTKIINQLQSNRNANILSAPKIALFNGMRAQITDATLRPFMVGQSKNAENSPGQPVVSTVSEGLSFEFRPELIDSQVTLNVQVGLSQIRRVNELTYRTSGQAENEGVTLQVPDVNAARFRFGFQPIKLGNTLVMATRNVDSSKDQVLILAITAKHLESGSGLVSNAMNSKASIQVPTAKAELRILGPTLKQGQSDNSSPSDDVLIHALERSVAHREILNAVRRRGSKFKISWRQVSETVEPTKFIPTIGYAQNLLTKFEATITGDDGKSLGQPIRITRSQIRMMDSSGDGRKSGESNAVAFYGEDKPSSLPDKSSVVPASASEPVRK